MAYNIVVNGNTYNNVQTITLKDSNNSDVVFNAYDGDSIENQLLLHTISGTYINNEIVKITNRTFNNCSLLLSVQFNNCTSIHEWAFNQCYNLSTVLLASCQYFNTYVFYNCFNLLSLYLLTNSQAQLQNINAFAGTPISDYTASTGGVYGSIYVPESLYSSYIAATNWVTYSSRFVSLTSAEILQIKAQAGIS